MLNIKKLLVTLAFIIVLIPSTTLAVNDSQKIVKAWAKAAQERNGKKQYLLLCKNQQNKNRADLESTHWVTGVSSPSIGDYKIIKLPKKHGAFFLVKYQIVLQGKSVGTVTDKLQIKNGCIAEFKYLSPTEGEPIH